MILKVSLSNANACSGRLASFEELALRYDLIVGVRIKMLIDDKNNYSKYSVDVIDEIKGKFKSESIEHSTISVSCGFETLEIGSEIYIAKLKERNNSKFVNIFNIYGRNTIAQVKKYVSTLDRNILKTDFSKYKNIENLNGVSNYIDLKNIKWENRNATLWFLTNIRSNLIGEDYQSFKAKATVSCSNNQFQLKSIFYFKEKNAAGGIINARDNEFRGELVWQNIEDGFTLNKIKVMICD
jgi:hypothetical protein